MHKSYLIAALVVTIVLIGSGVYWWSSGSKDALSQASGSDAIANETSGVTDTSGASQDSELTTAEEMTATAFATKVERYTQQRDFAKLYDLVCPQDRSGVTKTEYVKAATNLWGANRLTSFEIKSVLEENDGATVQLVENTSDGKSEAQLMPLEKTGTGWCFRSNLTSTISQIKNFQNIALNVTSFKRPYTEQYQTAVEEAYERVRVNVSIKNSGDKPLICHALDGGETQCNEFFFYLKDSAGAIYTPGVISDAKMPQFTLAAKSTVSGGLVFEIPVGSSGYTLVFKDLGYGTDIAAVSTDF